MQRNYTSEERREINRALAKAMAYKQCGKQVSANSWAARLLGLLECAEIIDPRDSYYQRAALGNMEAE